MEARIRIRSETESYELCHLDLMKFSEEQVRERMADRGFDDEAFYITGFSDWGIDVIMTLQEAYLLVKAIKELYDGDDYVVRYLLMKRKPVTDIIGSHYFFVGKDEQKVLTGLLEHADPKDIVDFWFKTQSTANALASYQEAGYILVTDKGIYKNLALG